MQREGGTLPRQRIRQPQPGAPAPCGLPPHDDMGDVVLAGVIQHRAHQIRRVLRDHTAAELHGKVQRRLHAGIVVIVFDMKSGERGAQGFRQPCGVAHDVSGRGIGPHQGQHALRHRPGAGNGAQAHILRHVPVDPLCGAAQRHFAQRAEIAFPEEIPQRPGRNVRPVDMAFLQTGAQLIRRQVDQFDLIGHVQHGVRDGFANPDAGDARHLVVQAFQMLHVQRAPHIDACFQQFLHILPAFGVAQAGGVGVGQLVHQQQLRVAGQGGVEVELLQRLAAIRHGVPWQNLKFADFLQGAGAAMGFDQPGHYVQPALALGMGGVQHLPGFADTRRRAKKDFQMAALPPFRAGQQRIRVWAAIILIRHAALCGGWMIQRKVKFQHVHMAGADDSEEGVMRQLFHQGRNRGGRQMPRGGHGGGLAQRIGQRNIRVQPRAGSGDGISGHRARAERFGVCRHTLPDGGLQRGAGGAEIGGAGGGGVIRLVQSRRARLEILGGGEVLADQGGADDFAVVFQQGAIGLPGQGKLHGAGEGFRQEKAQKERKEHD